MMTTTPAPRSDSARSGDDRPTREQALKAAEQAWMEQEQELGREALRSLKPWKGKAQRQDKVLLTVALLLPALLLLTLPLRPLFIADHPLALALVTGSHAAVGAASAFIGVGQGGALWVVILAGVIGKIKIDWIFWWLGRRWGRGIVNFLIQGERGRRFADRLETMNPWVMRALVPLSYLPGIPAGITHVIAGANGMRLHVYMLLNALGAAFVTSIVAIVGYSSGQTGVDVVLLIDKYALWIMLALIFGMALYPTFTASRDQKARKTAALEKAAAEYDAETARLEAEDRSTESTIAPTTPTGEENPR
ncbi:DedA family protein [Nocardiopsis alba]|uniref:DedA family protein n=1 Tax=Nocardiopsis alba TaxID=53437 RepID=UPI00339FE59D